MLQLGILIMIYYCVHFTASTDPELSVVQYPEDASVLLNSTVWMLCVFEYPEEENEMPVVYWRKGPDYNNLQSLQSSTGAARPHVRIIKNVLKGFSILKLSNVDHSASNSYFCDVTLTQNVQSKRGSGTNLTVHDLKCKDCIRSDKTWWGWFLLLGYTIFVTTVIIAFIIHQGCKKCKNRSRNTDSSATSPSDWIYDKPSRPVNNGFNQEYVDMSLIRTFTDTGRKMI
ncbi:uncharacterized protein LOC112989573 isoform X1 [Dromaius novaehollandiae]|uniref:uncharacterized protein LOC112989573 isoform X1 n=1 Tax=Dromaius novaehollandiae TaxID=8790 RepID=UPI000E1F82FB|nr:uncharacterized protein LOC112989573 isoform X1 [Dromaius novaehollandiae]